MEIDSSIGIFIIIIALASLVALSWWSHRFIDRINNAGPATLRQILNSLTEEKRHG